MTMWPFKPKRHWFQDADGTYFRNAPLILNEMKETRWWQNKRWAALTAEHDRVFWQGVDRKDTLDRGDVVVQMRPFREAYPNHPGLWVLDEPDRYDFLRKRNRQPLPEPYSQRGNHQ